MKGYPFLNPGATSISGLFLADTSPESDIKKYSVSCCRNLAAAAIPGGQGSTGISFTINGSLTVVADVLPVAPIRRYPLSLVYRAYVAVVDSMLCKGCGNCISVCPSNAADSPFRDQAYLEQTLEELLLGYRLGEN
jgi:ferredoxin